MLGLEEELSATEKDILEKIVSVNFKKAFKMIEDSIRPIIDDEEIVPSMKNFIFSTILTSMGISMILSAATCVKEENKEMHKEFIHREIDRAFSLETESRGHTIH